MSRLRITFDSVTKAVGSTDLISKFSRFKPGSASADSSHAQKVLSKETLNNTSTEATMKEEEEGEKKEPAEEESDKKQVQQVAEKPFVATKKSTTPLSSNASAPSSSSTMAKQTMQLFHPAALSTNMDETSKSLANHINSYFGTSSQGEDGENRLQQHREESEPLPHSASSRTGDHNPVLSPVSDTKSIKAPSTSPVSSSPSENASPVAEVSTSQSPASADTAQSTPAPTTSPKKGFTQYLSYPRPSVQAFVGSYIAPLVPRFRGDAKRVAAEKDASPAVTVDEPAVDKAGEKADSEEEKAEKVKQQLISQREKVGMSNSDQTRC